MAIKEIKREWCPSQLAYVKEFLLHREEELQHMPRCSVGSKATVSETDNEYVKTTDGWKLLCDCDEDGGQGAGGGGSSVQPDWNQNDPNAADYVKNRTHCKEMMTLFEGEVTVTNGLGVLPIQKYMEGESYTVLFDGTEYNCVAFAASFGGTVSIGDEELVFNPEQSDVKYPFFCAAGQIVARDGVHDVTVVGSGYRTIKPEYLPNCIVYSNRTRNDITGQYYYVMYRDKECTQPVLGVDRDIASFIENGMLVVVYDVTDYRYHYPRSADITNGRIIVRYIGTDESSNLIDCAVMSE